ncbi:MAG: hypothetical protein JNJ84_06460 [Rhodobacteraceae bacterium]|nr:hypothetical protein [Paracoccaceae bacterium]
MVRVHEGMPVTELPLIVPEPRLPPEPQQPEAWQDPATPQPGVEQSLDEAMGGQTQPQQQRDPLEEILRDILGTGN